MPSTDAKTAAALKCFSEHPAEMEMNIFAFVISWLVQFCGCVFPADATPVEEATMLAEFVSWVVTADLL